MVNPKDKHKFSNQIRRLVLHTAWTQAAASKNEQPDRTKDKATIVKEYFSFFARTQNLKDICDKEIVALDLYQGTTDLPLYCSLLPTLECESSRTFCSGLIPRVQYTWHCAACVYCQVGGCGRDTATKKSLREPRKHQKWVRREGHPADVRVLGKMLTCSTRSAGEGYRKFSIAL